MAGFLTGALDIVGGLLGAQGQREANAANMQIAGNQMDFQAAMSNTAHQREVADLRAAGLNPILSANAGASTPQGASTQMTNTLSSIGQGVSNSAKDWQDYNNKQDLTDSTVQTNKTQQDTNKAVQKLTDIKSQTEQNQAKASEEIANQQKMETAIKAEGFEARKTQAKVQPYIDMASQAVGTVVEGVGGAFVGKKIMDSLGAKIKPGQGLLKDGTKFDTSTGEILNKP